MSRIARLDAFAWINRISDSRLINGLKDAGVDISR